MAKHCKCKQQEECEECPEWIFTFADLVMLMMGFFVILWVLKPAPGKADTPEANEEWLKLVAKIREAFDYLPDPQSKDPVDQLMLLQKLQNMKPLKGPGDGGKTKIDRKGAEGDQPEVVSVRRGSQAIVGSRVLFDPGSATLSAESKKILDQIALLIKGHKNIMLVRGHASLDDYPEGADFQQQLDLSIRRAKVVADYLVSHGVAPEILRVLGCSTYEPVIQRAYTPELKQLNRRVEVESTTTLVVELQDPAPIASPANERTTEESAAPKQTAATTIPH
ncbi:MAG TPA: OmpA family protein [Tepidisphaeraceae bacterium]|jgi:flagellar motor protein MotB|nr:OmpA family protein [Tepidisphaeraceae bacterium]